MFYFQIEISNLFFFFVQAAENKKPTYKMSDFRTPLVTYHDGGKFAVLKSAVLSFLTGADRMANRAYTELSH